MEKIAVHCMSQGEKNAVLNKAYDEGYSWGTGVEKILAEEFKPSNPYLCLGFNGQPKNLMNGDEEYKKNGYTIIPASEYLGGDMFKVGDRVEVLKEMDGRDYVGHHGKITYIRDCGGGKVANVKFGNGNEWEFYFDRIKLINNKKENNMKENNINKNVLEVFGDLPAKEVVIIDKHFDDEMLNVILMDKFKKEIKAACIEAEEKLKEVNNIE